MSGAKFRVPEKYAPPQIIEGGNSGVTVVPSTPTGFGVIQTGTTMGVEGAGNTSFSQTQLNGFVNYGSPIRTLAPIYDQQGRQVGTKVITVSPNPILVPVTGTIQINQ